MSPEMFETIKNLEAIAREHGFQMGTRAVRKILAEILVENPGLGEVDLLQFLEKRVPKSLEEHLA